MILITALFGPTQLKARYPLAPRVGRFLFACQSVRLPLLAAALLVLCLASARAATKNATSVSQVDVAAAITSAADGDTVVIPAGSATWTVGLDIRKAITLKGQGIGTTIITNGAPAGYDNFIKVGGVQRNKTLRITGIEFAELFQHSAALILLNGRNVNSGFYRVDHCKFSRLQCFNIYVNGVLGVIDNNYFLANGTATPIYVFHPNWNDTGTQSRFGYGSLADTSHFGTNQFMFVEDNTFIWPPGGSYSVIDGTEGARWVFRHNNVTNGWCEAHAGGGGNIGTRAGEIYNNTFTNENVLIANLRSGVFLVHHNTSTFPNSIIRLVNYQLLSLGNTFGMANGKNPWDVNLPGHPFYTGTAMSGSIGASNGTVTVSPNPNWTPNQWSAYSVVKTAGAGLPGMTSASEIRSNTADTLTYTRSIFPPELLFSNGDTLEINKVKQSMDMIARSGGTLIPYTPATPASSPPPGWNNQITDPCYEWNNTFGASGNINFDSGQSSVYHENEHYFNDTPAPGYTPYTYPHPLRSEPSNLRVVQP